MIKFNIQHEKKKDLTHKQNIRIAWHVVWEQLINNNTEDREQKISRWVCSVVGRMLEAKIDCRVFKLMNK